MNSAIWSAVEDLVSGDMHVALAVTGGGSALLNWLFDHPGASRVLLEAQIPYGNKALDEYVQTPGPHRVSRATARDMAAVAYGRARRFGDRPVSTLGVGLTAALATERARRGDDRAHLALRTAECYRFCELGLRKGAAGRAEQEGVLSRWALGHIAAAFDVRFEAQLPEWADGEVEQVDLDDPLGLLLCGALDVVEVDLDGAVGVDVERTGRLLYPGSFNPLHEGHCQLAQVAGQLSGRVPALELSVNNVDKAPLERAEIERRLAALRGRFRAILTREPTFYGKASHFAAPHFVIGCDTAMRLVDGKYYDGGMAAMERALAELRDRDVRFWVAGRRMQSGYKTLEDVAVPTALSALFAPIAESAFRMDISSTEIRARQQGA